MLQTKDLYMQKNLLTYISNVYCAPGSTSSTHNFKKVLYKNNSQYLAPEFNPLQEGIRNQ